MIRLTKIIEDLTKPHVKEAVDPSLLKMIKDILSKEPIDKAKLDVALSNYKRYFDRDADGGNGTDEVKRGMTMQSKLDELAK